MYHGSSRILRTWAAGLAMAGIAGLASPGTAGARPPAGTPPAYTLELKALLNAGNVSDVSLRVIPASAAVPIPPAARQILLQAFAADGVTVIWSKSYANAPLDAQGRAGFSFTNLLRYQLLRAQAVIQTPGTTKTQTYRVDGRVLNRPDLEVQTPTVPSQVLIQQPVTIQAPIHEIYGDVGATCDVVLRDASNTVLDSALGVSVGAGGTVGVVLTTQFPAAGTYNLAVEIRNSNPTEFDAAGDLNNGKKITVLVTATIPTGYSASYDDATSHSHSIVRNFDFARTTLLSSSDSRKDGESEFLGYSSFFSTPLLRAGFSVHVQADGVDKISASIAPEDPHATKSDDDGMGNSFTSISYFFFLNLDETDWLQFNAQTGTGIYSGRTFSSLSVQHSASDFVYFSCNFDLLFGHQVFSSHDIFGTFWQARSTIHTDIRVIAEDGTEYGGRSDTALSFSTEDYGPSTATKEDEARNFYSESTEEFHLSRWSGNGLGTTY